MSRCSRGWARLFSQPEPGLQCLLAGRGQRQWGKGGNLPRALCLWGPQKFNRNKNILISLTLYKYFKGEYLYLWRGPNRKICSGLPKLSARSCLLELCCYVIRRTDQPLLCCFSENDLLKHQLRKYVAAVQSLRRNESADIGTSSTHGRS